MLREEGEAGARRERVVELNCDLAVAGGGLAGVCCAITAARAGVKVVLIQDRPVLGGNASSEVRLWILGATSHMGNNNRWAREGGVIDEILVENMYRNPEGNPLILDALLLEKVTAEAGITLLLNAAVHQLEKSDPDTISAIHAWCSQNSTDYVVRAPLFCDASGDGIAGFLAGAAFRMGAESRDEFGEGFAPPAEYGELLGHSMYFYSKDTGRPVRFIPPAFALHDIRRIPRFRDIRASDSGCRFWWFEYGGRMDTIHDTETIKWELWRVIYGVWDYIKNSGQFPEAETMTLEWVGTIPGKRESRRFEGDLILTQRDIVEQREYPDAVSFGGWAMDLHPADGIYSELSPCTQWHSKGVYQIPYRTMYSRNIRNLFLTGRLISVSHVAFGSTRVMATCAHNGQAVGLAAALCARHGLAPREAPIAELQRQLLGMGQHIPGIPLDDPEDLARKAVVRTSSCFEIEDLKPDGDLAALDASRAMLLPVAAGALPAMTFLVDATRDTILKAEVRSSSRLANYTPDEVLHSQSFHLKAGKAHAVRVAPSCSIETGRYLSYCLLRNEDVSVHLTSARVTGVLSLVQTLNKAVAKGTRQEPPEGSGIDQFEFWLPERRPGGKNLALSADPPLRCFCGNNVLNGIARPGLGTNAWVAAPSDAAPRLTLHWDRPVPIGRIELSFDTDFDHPMESVMWGHPERAMPFCVKRYRVLDDSGAVLHESGECHQTRNSLVLSETAVTKELHLEVLETHGAPAAIFSVRCYER